MDYSGAMDWLGGGWRSSRFVTSVGNATGLDVDGWYGWQCRDFVQGYSVALGHPLRPGNAIDLWTTPQDGYYQRIPYTPGFVPKGGDIYVLGAPYGKYVDEAGAVHYLGDTGVVLPGSSSSRFIGIGQNQINPNLTKGSPPASFGRGYAGFMGVLRPEFNQEEDMGQIQDLQQQVKDLQARVDLAVSQATAANNRADGLQTELEAERKGYELQIADLKQKLADAGAPVSSDPDSITITKDGLWDKIKKFLLGA